MCLCLVGDDVVCLCLVGDDVMCLLGSGSCGILKFPHFISLPPPSYPPLLLPCLPPLLLPCLPPLLSSPPFLTSPPLLLPSVLFPSVLFPSVLFPCSLTSLCTESASLKDNGIPFVETVTRLIALLLDYRNVPTDDANKGRRTGCMLNLLVRRSGLCLCLVISDLMQLQDNMQTSIMQA